MLVGVAVQQVFKKERLVPLRLARDAAPRLDRVALFAAFSCGGCLKPFAERSTLDELAALLARAVEPKPYRRRQSRCALCLQCL
jgi:hypothetical protein